MIPAEARLFSFPSIDEAFAAAVQRHQAREFPAALEIYRAILDVAPRHAGARHLLGVASHQIGDNATALQSIQTAIEIDPSQSKFFYNLGVVLQAESRLQEAEQAYRQSLALDPCEGSASNNLANLHCNRGAYDAAGECLQQGLTSDPQRHSLLGRFAANLRMQGRVDEAVNVLRTALLIQPHDPRTHSMLLFTRQYCVGPTLADFAAEHREWGRQQASGLPDPARTFSNHNTNPDRPLRIGFVSSDLSYHPVGMFALPVVEGHDRSQFSVVIYNNTGRRDGLSQRLEAASEAWREVGQLSDEEFIRRVEADRIDILFDLNGHTDDNRLPVFARRAAPIQITWAGYVGTTGVPAMDYVLADAYHVPAEFEPFYTEKILRMPNGYICYAPPEYGPEPAPPPSTTQDFITFGSLNNPTKFSTATMEVWSQILQRVPGSRLIMKYKGCNDSTSADRITQGFAEHGITADRIDLRGGTTHAEHLGVYREIDIALDPFPYSGGVTTCEAVWMGVPVVTCPGETFASRHSLSHLTNAGLPELITSSRDEYIELAVALANDSDRLTELHASLRLQMEASPLCDAKGYVHAFEERMRFVWREWCQGRET